MRTCRLLLLALSSAATRCGAWTATAQIHGVGFDALRAGLTQYVWTTPSGQWDEQGLGGGLTYAWDSTLCDDLLPHFNERHVWGVEFVSCKSLRAAMERAFASWEANHALVRFHDVTNMCSLDNSTPPGGTGCSLAEVWITNNGAGGTETNDQAASAQMWTFTSAYPAAFGFANGQPGGSAANSIARVKIGFSTNICWYLDSTFCSHFHSLKDLMGADEFLDMTRIVLFTLWGFLLLEATISVVRVLFRIFELMRLSVVGLLDTDKVSERRGRSHAIPFPARSPSPRDPLPRAIPGWGGGAARGEGDPPHRIRLQSGSRRR